MPDSQLFCHGAGDVVVRLDRHYRVMNVGRASVEMCHKLIECFDAGAAGITVFEEQQRTTFRSGKEPVEFLKPVD